MDLLEELKNLAAKLHSEGIEYTMLFAAASPWPSTPCPEPRLIRDS